SARPTRAASSGFTFMGRILQVAVCPDAVTENAQTCSLLLLENRPQLLCGEQILRPPQGLLCANQILDRDHSATTPENFDLDGRFAHPCIVAHSLDGAQDVQRTECRSEIRVLDLCIRSRVFE